jgi:hypothetical protein
MATVLILCGIIGHFLGSTDLPSRDVCSTLYPAPRRRFSKPSTSNRIAAKLPRSSTSGEN